MSVEFITHVSKIATTTRPFDVTGGLTGEKGDWVEVSNGVIKKITAGAPLNPQILFATMTNSIYESHDTRASGQVTTIESPEVRFVTDPSYVTGAIPAYGIKLTVETVPANLAMGNRMRRAVAGDMVYATVESVNGTKVCIKTISSYKFA